MLDVTTVEGAEHDMRYGGASAYPLGLEWCVEGGNFVGDFVVSQAVVACCVHKVGSRRGLERG